MRHMSFEQFAALITAYVIWWLTIAIFFDRIYDQLEKVIDFIAEQFVQIAESFDAPSHQPNVTLLDQMRRRAQRRSK